MTLSKRVITLILVLFTVMAGLLSGLQYINQKAAAERDAEFFLKDMYGTLVYRALRSQMFIGRPDKAREMYGEIREVLSETAPLSASKGLASWLDPSMGTQLYLKDLTVLRRDGVEAFIDDKTIDEVNNRTGESFPQQMDERKPRKFTYPQIAQAVKTLSDTRLIEETPDGQDLVFFKPLPNTERCRGCHGEDHKVRGVVMLRIPLSPLEKRVRREGIRLGLLILLGAGLTGVLLLVFLRRWVIRPVKELETTARRIAEGETDVSAPLTGTDELARFSQQFSEMLRFLREDKRPAATDADLPPNALVFFQGLESPNAQALLKGAGAHTHINLGRHQLLATFAGPDASVLACLAALHLTQNQGAAAVVLWEGESSDLEKAVLPEKGVRVACVAVQAEELTAQGFLLKSLDAHAWTLEGIAKNSAADRLDPDLWKA